MSFLDAFLGYNQTKMDPADEEKKNFFYHWTGTYCYKILLFMLNNTRAIYQHLMNKMFAHYLGNSMEVYNNYILAKSKKSNQNL